MRKLNPAQYMLDGWEKVETGVVKTGDKIWLPAAQWRDAEVSDIGNDAECYFYVIRLKGEQ